MKNNPISILRSAVIGMIVMLALGSCSKQNLVDPGTTMNPGGSPIPKSPGTIIVPADNPMTAAKIELGRHLFYDTQLSIDNSTSCGSCHDPSIGFADLRGLATSMGHNQLMGKRNAPSLANVAYNTFYTWDGSFKSLEQHAGGPIFNSVEMGNNFSTGRDPQDTIPSGYHSDPGNNDTLFLFKRLNDQTDAAGRSFPDLYIAAWGGKGQITLDGLTKAIACFERTFISTNSVFDQYNTGKAALNAKALHGFQLFTDTKGANCIGCHSGYNFTDQQFHNNGIGFGKNIDSGRAFITHKVNDMYTFKTPSLRNVALSAPYMHDGRFSNLTQVLQNYNKGGNDPNVRNLDSKIHPLNLSDEDISDIIEFLKTLNDPAFTVNTNFSNPWAK